MPNAFTIAGKCNRCGGTVFTVPDNAADSAWIDCDGCGEHFMTWGDYKAQALSVAADVARKGFARVKGFKPR